jgi:hypothetical protein
MQSPSGLDSQNGSRSKRIVQKYNISPSEIANLKNKLRDAHIAEKANNSIIFYFCLLVLVFFFFPIQESEAVFP